MTLVVIVLLLASGLFSCLLILALCLAAKGGPKAPPQPAKKDKTMLHPSSALGVSRPWQGQRRAGSTASVPPPHRASLQRN